MDRGALAGYSPWGHKESDRTERLTLSLFQDRATHTFTFSIGGASQRYFLHLEKPRNTNLNPDHAC